MSPRPWTLYKTSEDAWDAMLAGLEKAERTIDFEQFTLKGLEPGQIGWRFLDVLLRKAQKGVSVRAIFDVVGCTALLASDWPERFEKAGATVRFYQIKNRREWTDFPLGWHRDHRKLCVIDRQAGYIGGVVETEEIRGFLDLHARFDGPVVPLLQAAFEDCWWRMSRSGRPLSKVLPPAEADGIQVIGNAANPSSRYLYRELVDRIKKARKRIWIVTPYFSPSFRLVHHLSKAVRRGVDVSLVVPKYSDVRLADYVAWNFYPLLHRRGIKIYLHEARKLHEKLWIADDWASFGSSNFDQLSFFNNLELNVGTERAGLVDELAFHFLENLAGSSLLGEDDMAKRSWLERLKTRLAFLLRDWA